MNLSRASIRRPIFTMMVVFVVLILGMVSFSRLSIDLMPDITYPTLTVGTSYPNANPEVVESVITRPIEQAMSAVPGVQEVTSSSQTGYSSVRVTFAWGRDLDAAAADVRDRLDRVIGRLPDDADRPVLSKFDVAAQPILIVGVHSHMEPVQFRQFVEDQVKYRIERVDGVASMDIWGGRVRQIQVNLLPDKIKGLGLSIDDIMSKVKAANLNLPAGFIERGNFEVTIRVPGEYGELADLGATVVAMRGGVPVRLDDVARVEDSWRRVRQIVRINGVPGLRIAIYKQSGTNTVEVAQNVHKEIGRINDEYPQIRMVPLIDTSDYIKRSISNVGHEAVYGGLLAILVIFFFLREVRSTAIIATSIPISIIATFGLMYFSGYTLNLMTLGGLALGVGRIVDDSIVVLENIYRLRDQGLDAEAASEQGSREVTAAIVASTLTTVAVFLPLIFVRGMAGVMFKQMSAVIAFSLLCSLLVATTLVPMLTSRLLRAEARREAGRAPGVWARAMGWLGRPFAWMEETYRQAIGWSLDHRAAVIITAAVLLAGGVALMPLLGVELMPASDEAEVRVNLEMDIGTRLELTDRTMERIEEIVRREIPDGERKDIVSSSGGGGPHTGWMRITLVPRRERTRSSEQAANDLRRKLRDIPGATVRTRAGQGLYILRVGFGGMDRVQLEVRGHDFATGEALARQVKAVVAKVEGVTDVIVSREAGGPEELILIDRQKAADMKVTVSQIANALQTCLGGTQTGTYREAGNEYAIVVKLRESEKLDLRDILDLTLTNADGEPVVLRNVVRVRSQHGPMRIERKNQERVINVSANITERDLGSVLADVRQELRTLPIPKDFTIQFGGDYEEQVRAFRELLLSLALALVLVYMVMACQYESLRDPFVIMFSVPLATLGVVVMLFVTDTTFNIQSFLGCIMLGGIVVSNAILLVDHANLLRRRDGLPLREAVIEAGRRRLRPILMTTACTILGLIPMALALGEGTEAQAPLARTVIGGLISSTLITLVVIPVVYSIFEGKDPAKTAA